MPISSHQVTSLALASQEAARVFGHDVQTAVAVDPILGRFRDAKYLPLT